MLEISNEKLTELKAKGFFFMKDKQYFNVRIVLPAGVSTAEDYKNIAILAEKYGNGKVTNTVRLNVEIPYIKYEDTENMMKDMEQMGLIYGGGGARVRPLVCCKGTICKFGLVDTQAICKELHDEFFEKQLPHKFKINITGCPNNCAKVQLNDLGFMGAPKNTLRVFIGGRFGRKSSIGEEICKIPVEKAKDVTRICLDFFSSYAQPKQRFCDVIAQISDTQEYKDFIQQLKSFQVK